MDTKNNTEREQWINNIASQRKSGLSPKEWCRQNHKHASEFTWWETLLQAEGYTWDKKETVEFAGVEYSLESIESGAATAGGLTEFYKRNGLTAAEFASIRNRLLYCEFGLAMDEPMPTLWACAVDSFEHRGNESADSWCKRHCITKQTIYAWACRVRDGQSVNEQEKEEFLITWADLEAFGFSNKSVAEYCRERGVSATDFCKQRQQMLCEKYKLSTELTDREFVKEFKKVFSAIPVCADKRYWLRSNGIDRFTQRYWGIETEETDKPNSVDELSLRNFREFATTGKTVAEYCTENGFSVHDFEDRRQLVVSASLGLKSDMSCAQYRRVICDLALACKSEEDRDVWLQSVGIDTHSFKAWSEQNDAASLQIRIGDAEFTINSIESVGLLQSVVSALSVEEHKWKYV